MKVTTLCQSTFQDAWIQLFDYFGGWSLCCCCSVPVIQPVLNGMDKIPETLVSIMQYNSTAQSTSPRMNVQLGRLIFSYV